MTCGWKRREGIYKSAEDDQTDNDISAAGRSAIRLTRLCVGMAWRGILLSRMPIDSMWIGASPPDGLYDGSGVV